MARERASRLSGSKSETARKSRSSKEYDGPLLTIDPNGVYNDKLFAAVLRINERRRAQMLQKLRKKRQVIENGNFPLFRASDALAVLQEIAEG